jgi:hypothetical protein
MVANYADRRKFESVVYTDTERGFCPEFPWFKLRELLREKCESLGLGFEHATAAETVPAV